MSSQEKTQTSNITLYKNSFFWKYRDPCPTEMQVHVSPCDMQCVHDPMFSSHSTNAVANIEKIRSKYVLSKIIDGLEKSAIVGQNLTTNTIYMMSNVEDEAVDSTFNFTKRIISEKSDTELEYESFFRTTAELDKELAGKTRLATMIYLANLRRTKSACVLKNDFLCLLDGDWNGNLKEIQKQNLVFLKMLKCKNVEGNKQNCSLGPKTQNKPSKNLDGGLPPPKKIKGSFCVLGPKEHFFFF